MPKKLTHLEIWVDSLIVAIPATIAFEWTEIQRQFFNREPSIYERFFVFFFGTAFGLYLFYYILGTGKD